MKNFYLCLYKHNISKIAFFGEASSNIRNKIKNYVQ